MDIDLHLDDKKECFIVRFFTSSNKPIKLLESITTGDGEIFNLSPSERHHSTVLKQIDGKEKVVLRYDAVYKKLQKPNSTTTIVKTTQPKSPSIGRRFLVLITILLLCFVIVFVYQKTQGFIETMFVECLRWIYSDTDE